MQLLRLDSRDATSDLSSCVAAFREEGFDSICGTHQPGCLLHTTAQGACHHDGRVGTARRGGSCTILNKGAGKKLCFRLCCKIMQGRWAAHTFVYGQQGHQGAWIFVEQCLFEDSLCQGMVFYS